MHKVILYYKTLISPGGAERLFAKEYQYFSSFGYDVKVVTNRLDHGALFGVEIPSGSLTVLNKSGIRAIFALASEMSKDSASFLLCSSGHIDVYLASLLSNFKYALHIHHPNYMSFNDYDKYSIFMSKHFQRCTESNFGAAEFKKIKSSLTYTQKILLNFRAFFSLASLQKSKCNFVLSNYAKEEKKRLYDIDSEVLCGALDDDYKIEVDSFSKNKKITLLTLARLDRNKRIDQLIDAVYFLKTRYIAEVSLLVVGDGPERCSLNEQIKRLNVEDEVKMMGFVKDEQLRKIYSQADVFVSIDWADYKITLFEALSHGLPVIASVETETDPRLIELGYVKLIKPTSESVAVTVHNMIDQVPNICPASLKPLLDNFTWGQYFRKIEECLLRRQLISNPNIG